MTHSHLQQGQAELPSASSTKSYWHRQPSPTLTGHRTTEQLPSSADVIVIGSGITGAFVARELVSGGQQVVMLEAREACWGATGRNGGHCQPAIYSNKPHLARFELATYTFLQDLIATHAIPCDWRAVGGVHALASDELAVLVERHLAHLRREHPDLAGKARLVTDVVELSRLRLTNARAAVVQSHAARCWPYKLVAWVLEQLLGDASYEGRFNLQTTTPATALQRFGSMWIVHTPRGQVAAAHVVLATNAHTSHLLPALKDLVVPVRGQVCALTPPRDAALLEHTHVWVAGDDSDDYLVERDADGDDGAAGPLIFGGERLGGAGGGVGVSRDDELDPDVSRRLHRGLHAALKLKPLGEPEEPELAAAYEWTGIMGYSADQYPWVGRVPASLGGADAGLWLSGGYTGHGMPVAARCAAAVAGMVLGRQTVDDVPAEFRITEERVAEVKDRVRRGMVPENMHESLADQIRATAASIGAS
ncbi:hypothetical protein S40285_06256 [Stachybotrys chlorohalonatus IBT 40285]|uniref:FAD dependent oxidoreductase domain-containing protein n=1 Tax=Stachybotrys chlorohalonatus (strain IBT 40285) TaxID=1283841 RepID=A0A084QSQ0_STAC4|nr:hypothetical protein S40285_06256 [Stachybotrys chlorohalonata IBT 40285]